MEGNISPCSNFCEPTYLQLDNAGSNQKTVDKNKLLRTGNVKNHLCSDHAILRYDV